MKRLIVIAVFFFTIAALAQDPFCGTACEDGTGGGGVCQYCKTSLVNNTVSCEPLWAMGNWWNATDGYTGCVAHNATPPEQGPNACTFSGNHCVGYVPEALSKWPQRLLYRMAGRHLIRQDRQKGTL